MKPVPHVASPPPKPLMVFDGDCSFCLFWVERWKHLTGNQVDYIPFQDPAMKFTELPPKRLETALHLINPDGSVYVAAEAAFRALAHNPREQWLLDWYEHSVPFSRSAEWIYRTVANHRTLFSTLTRLAWGRILEPPSYQLLRQIFLRSLGFIYLIAFVSLWLQISGLNGDNGILPANLTMGLARQQFTNAGISFDRYHQFPTLCWADTSYHFLQAQCAAGTTLAVLLMLGVVPAPCLFLLWLLYLSLSTVGSDFLSFQWDTLLLETGFLAIFFAPWQWFWRSSRAAPPSRAVLWLLRWLLFRLMFESGWVKLLSGDPFWRSLTALNFHYETQPLPTWIGWYAHQLPPWFQKSSTVVMFGIELVLPLLVFAPRRLRQIPCAGFILFQLLILLTGNYCFFNLLTILLSVMLLDDAGVRGFISFCFPKLRGTSPGQGLRATNSEEGLRGSNSEERGANSGEGLRGGGSPGSRLSRRLPVWLSFPLVCVVLVVSLLELTGMFGVRLPWPRPVIALYQWVAPFRSINHYGLFAVMTTERLEIIVEGSDDGLNWLPYEFRYKPGDLKRRPRFVEPHQPRLDWQMWFAALGTYHQNPWFINFCARLLLGSPEVLALLERNPFPAAPPRYIRAELYRYHFTDLATRRKTGEWWRRELVGLYMPALSIRKEGAGEGPTL